MPGGSTPWREAAYSVVDLELTGLDPSIDEIASFATVGISGGRIRVRDSVHHLVRPRRMPGPETIRIHGLRRADLEAAAPLDRVLDELLAALTGRVLVAHVAGIEESFLSAALEAHGLHLRNPIVDTAPLAAELSRRRQGPLSRALAKLSPGPRRRPGLSGLARSLGLPVHRPHHADGDALTTAQVFLALATHLDRIEPLTVGALESLSRPIAVRMHPNDPG
ncbi:MAG: exonuclease domain-containing protein [Solirubrobacterales bacterium]